MHNILIIEDDINLIELYQAKFSLEGFEVLTASDGAQGIEAAVANQPEVILLDVLMPQVNGFEVLKQLKDHKETKNIPVIVYTNLGSSDSDEKRELAFSLGAADYLVKALHEPDSIVERVLALLHSRSGQQGEEAMGGSATEESAPTQEPESQRERPVKIKKQAPHSSDNANG